VPLAVSYVLPLRHDTVEDEDVAELGVYVRRLATVVDDVVVVDGSPRPVFDAHAAAFGDAGSVRHLPPDPRYSFANGKVDGVLTGLDLARNEAVVVADEDVRWDAAELARAASLLGDADVVRPQNYYSPLPWHARWDTARILLNRAIGADYPGTLAVRRSTLLDAGGYDGHAMFENLELIRTVRAVGGTVDSPLDLYVRRLPPTFRQFRSQRVREAFDDFAQPPRLVASLAVLPLVVSALARRRRRALAVALVVLPVLAAERGRRRAGGRRYFPASCVPFAPLWVLERAVCSWIAVGCRVVRGGPRYRGRVMRLAANPQRELRRRLHARV
jgi:hypothetical protein